MQPESWLPERQLFQVLQMSQLRRNSPLKWVMPKFLHCGSGELAPATQLRNGPCQEVAT